MAESGPLARHNHPSRRRTEPPPDAIGLSHDVSSGRDLALLRQAWSALGGGTDLLALVELTGDGAGFAAVYATGHGRRGLGVHAGRLSAEQ
jgi:hypothetical protein